MNLGMINIENRVRQADARHVLELTSQKKYAVIVAMNGLPKSKAIISFVVQNATIGIGAEYAT